MFSDYNFSLWPRKFEATYKCFSVATMPGNERPDVERGNKIILPQSALEKLTKLNVTYPMLFKLKNSDKNCVTHAGVLEFVAEEDICHLPNWMMSNLLLEEGDNLNVESASLPVASFSKFQPQNVDFLDITDPKAILENALRCFACLTVDDVIAIQYNKKVYELKVLETKPEDAVCIIECDMNVEFEAPVGYVDPTQSKANENESIRTDQGQLEEIVDPFVGPGNRLDGKKQKQIQVEEKALKKVVPRGVPDYDYKSGNLKFDRSIRPISDQVVGLTEEPQPTNDDEFHGQGNSLLK